MAGSVIDVLLADAPCDLDQHEPEKFWFIVTNRGLIGAVVMGADHLILAFAKPVTAKAYALLHWPDSVVMGPASLEEAFGALRRDVAAGENRITGIYFPEDGTRVPL